MMLESSEILACCVTIDDSATFCRRINTPEVIALTFSSFYPGIDYNVLYVQGVGVRSESGHHMLNSRVIA